MNVERVIERLAELDPGKPVMFAEFPANDDYAAMEVIEYDDMYRVFVPSIGEG